MERLNLRLDQAQRAIATLAEVSGQSEPTALVRDAAIQRFEYSVELVWKCAKQYLYDMEGQDLGSPKAVMRALRENGLLSHEQATGALEMIDDRNLTSHTYNEALATRIYVRLDLYKELMAHIIKAIKLKLQDTR